MLYCKGYLLIEKCMTNQNIRNRIAPAENIYAGIVFITRMETLKIAWNMNVLQAQYVDLKNIIFFNCA